MFNRVNNLSNFTVKFLLQTFEYKASHTKQCLHKVISDLENRILNNNKIKEKWLYCFHFQRNTLGYFLIKLHEMAKQ